MAEGERFQSGWQHNAAKIDFQHAKTDFTRIVRIEFLRADPIKQQHLNSAAMIPVDQLFDQKTAARLLGISVRTLERFRVAGTGPRYVRLGRLVRYRQQDLVDFVDRNLRRSTSEESTATDPVPS